MRGSLPIHEFGMVAANTWYLSATRDSFSCSFDSLLASAVKGRVDVPVFVKVGINMREAVRAAVDAGVDGITAINTVPAMKIDVDTGKPLFKNGRCGLSGPPIRSIALNEVYHIVAGYGTPVIGCGGVSSGEDALAFMQAGAGRCRWAASRWTSRQCWAASPTAWLDRYKGNGRILAA